MFFLFIFGRELLCCRGEFYKWLVELRGVSARSLNSGRPRWQRGGAAEAASASRLGRFSTGLDVGSVGLFWLRGVGLCKHAKLAASSKRIGESGESSWNLLFLSLTLASRCLIPAPLKPFLMMTLSASHWKAEDRRPRGLQHRGFRDVAATLAFSPSRLPPELLISFIIFYCLALNMHKWNNLQTPGIWKCTSPTHGWRKEASVSSCHTDICIWDIWRKKRRWWTKSKHSALNSFFFFFLGKKKSKSVCLSSDGGFYSER